MQEKFEEAQESDTEFDEKVVNLGDVNEPASENLTFSMKTCSAVGKAAIGMVWNKTCLGFLRETAKQCGTSL